MAWAHSSGLGYLATRLRFMGLAPGIGWKQSSQEVLHSRSSDRSGFYDITLNKRRGGKIVSYKQWRLGDLVLAKVKGFPTWLTKVRRSIFHPHLFSLI